MAERLIKIYLPAVQSEEVANLLEEDEVVGMWIGQLEEGAAEVTVLPRSEANEEVLERLEQRFGNEEDYRLVMLPVVASLPRQDEEAAEDASGPEESEGGRSPRISREELYQDVARSTELSAVYLVLLLLATVVAATGMLRNDPAVIIGAMVIAPLLGPNVALSLATTLGDARLATKAATVSVVGAALVLAFSVLAGILFNNLLASPEIASRTQVDLSSIAVALAAGAAGALSFTTGAPAALIGVMVAVALLPPLVSFGMLMGGGLWTPALGALLLFLVNIICVNLAGVATFLLQGVVPSRWFEAKNARRATLASIALWLSLLALLVAVIVLADPATNFSLEVPGP